MSGSLMWHIKKLVNNFRTVVLMFNIFLKNTLPKNCLIEHVIVDGAGLFRVLEFGLKNLIMLVKDSTLLWHEHEIILVVVLFLWVLN